MNGINVVRRIIYSSNVRRIIFYDVSSEKGSERLSRAKTVKRLTPKI